MECEDLKVSERTTGRAGFILKVLFFPLLILVNFGSSRSCPVPFQ